MKIKKTIFPYVEENPLETISGVGSSFNTGMENLLSNRFSQLIVSHAYIYWYRLPVWFENDVDLKYFKQITQRNIIRFDGISDITLNTSDRLSGSGNPIAVASGVELGNTDFSIEMNESSGSVMRKLYQKWISGVRDPQAKICTYARDHGIDYSDYNNTGELMYIVVRPDANNEKSDILEFAMLQLGVMPTNIPLSHFNWGRGEENAPTITVNFKGTPQIGPLVDDMARGLLTDRILNISSTAEAGTFCYPDSYGSDERITELINTGTLAELYKSE